MTISPAVVAEEKECLLFAIIEPRNVNRSAKSGAKLVLVESGRRRRYDIACAIGCYIGEWIASVEKLIAQVLKRGTVENIRPRFRGEIYGPSHD